MRSWGFVPCNMHHRILLEWLENGDPLYRKTLLCETLVTESSNTSTRELKWQIRKNAKGNRKSCCAYRVTDTLVFGGNKGLRSQGNSNVSIEPATYQTEIGSGGLASQNCSIHFVPHYGITVEHAQKLKFNLSEIMRNEKGNCAGWRKEGQFFF